MSVFVPRPYQRPMTQFIIDTPRCNLYAGMGTGKGPATLEAIATLLLFGEVQRVLVVAPKRVALSTWPGEIQKFCDSFGHMTCAVAIGDATTRHAAIRFGADITTINYDNLTWLVDNYGTTWPFDMIVCDESSRLAGLRVSLRTSKNGKQFLTGQGGSRAKSLARVALTKAKRFVNLSGTPAANGLEQLWGQCFYLDAGRRLGTSFTAFQQRWFRQLPGGDNYARIEPMPHADSQIRAAIKDVTIAIEARDHFDLPPLIENIIHVDMPPSARKQYKEMERDLFTWLVDGRLLEAFSAGAKSQKCLQLAAGAAYTDDQGNWVEVHDAKIEALQSVIEEAAGMPVLVFYHFKSDLARIQKALPKAVHLGAKTQTIDDWNAGRIPVLLAHPQSAGHGLSLQHGGNICCFFSSNWSLEADSQAIERIGPTRQAQSGYKRPVFVHRIVAKGTLDEVVVARLKSKASIQDALMEAMKNR